MSVYANTDFQMFQIFFDLLARNYKGLGDSPPAVRAGFYCHMAVTDKQIQVQFLLDPF